MQKVLRQDGTVWVAIASMRVEPKWTGEHVVTIAPSEESSVEEYVDIMAYEVQSHRDGAVWREMH